MILVIIKILYCMTFDGQMFPLISWTLKNFKRHSEKFAFDKCCEDTLKIYDKENSFSKYLRNESTDLYEN